MLESLPLINRCTNQSRSIINTSTSALITYADNKNKEVRLSHQLEFTQWMTEHEKMLRHMIMGFEAKSAIQDELYQDIALNIWQALPKFKHQSSVKTFVARIAHNILATHVAKSVRTIKADVDIDDSIELESSHETPYQQLDKVQRQQRLSAAIRQLKLEQQQVLTLALEGMSYQEIAEILVISTNLVGVRLQRAKAALMKLLAVI